MSKIIIFPPVYPSSGSGVSVSPSCSVAGRTHPGQDTRPPQGHSHPPSLRWGQGPQAVHLTFATREETGEWRKPTYADEGELCRDLAQPGSNCLPINLTPKRRYSRTCCPRGNRERTPRLCSVRQKTEAQGCLKEVREPADP